MVKYRNYETLIPLTPLLLNRIINCFFLLTLSTLFLIPPSLSSFILSSLILTSMKISMTTTLDVFKSHFSFLVEDHLHCVYSNFHNLVANVFLLFSFEVTRNLGFECPVNASKHYLFIE